MQTETTAKPTAPAPTPPAFPAGLIIGGAVEPGAAEEAVIDPATGAAFATAPAASTAQVDKAVRAAAAAFPAWSGAPLEARHAAIRAFAALIRANLEDLARLLTLEQGKPLHKAKSEINGAVAFMESYCAIDLAPEVLRDTPAQRVELRRAPVGVVAAITAWNYPALLALWKLGPAMAAGCTMVVKPAPTTPLTTLRLGELAQEAFPAGVVNVITGGAEVGGALAAHPDVAKIAFTGSTRTGQAIMAAAAPTLKRLTLELGGNDAGVVLDDVDVEAAAGDLFWAKFSNCGQVCAALKRLYVHDSVYEPLIEALIGVARTVKIGDGFTDGVEMGPIQNRAQHERLSAMLADAERRGATVLYRGAAPAGPGLFFPIVILGEVPDDAQAVQEEAFGPILTVHRYTDVEEALARANASEFGLGASVWGRDVARAADLAARMEAGSCWVNQHPAMGPDIPFGGVKRSGLGVEGARWGLEEYTNIQVLNIKRNDA